jgi:hypothetical protein
MYAKIAATSKTASDLHEGSRMSFVGIHSIGRFLEIVLVGFGTTLFGCGSSASLSSLAKSPPHPVQQEQRFQSLNRYQQDLLYFTSVLQETHPEPYRHITREQFNAETQRLLQKFAVDTSDTEFRICLQGLASRLRDSHTQVSIGNFPDQRSYPLGVVWMKDTLFIAAVSETGDTSLIGTAIVAINGVPILDAVQRIAQSYSYDNLGWVRWKLFRSLLSPYVLQREGIASSDTLWLTTRDFQGTTRVTQLFPESTPKLRYTHVPTRITGRRNDFYWYTILPADSLCYFQFNTMFDKHALSMFGFFQRIPLYFLALFKGVGYFDSFVDDMLEEMHAKDVRTLVIDLRGNSGGNGTLGSQLLYKLGVDGSIRGFSTSVKISPLLRASRPDDVERYERQYARRTGLDSLPDSLFSTDSLENDEPTPSDYFSELKDEKSDYFTKPPRFPFTGRVFFISGEGTFSSGSLLATVVEDNHLFPMVGQPTGQASHYGDLLILRLPKTDTYCEISCKKFVRPDKSKNTQSATIPDIEIWPAFDAFHRGTDPVFDWILRHTRQNN